MSVVNSVVAILAAFRRRPSPFERTPKFGIAGQGDTWQGKAYRAAVSRVTVLEVAFLLWNVNTVRLAINASNWAIAFYATVFATGLAYVLGLTLLESIRHRRAARAAAEAASSAKSGAYSARRTQSISPGADGST